MTLKQLNAFKNKNEGENFYRSSGYHMPKNQKIAGVTQLIRLIWKILSVYFMNFIKQEKNWIALLMNKSC